MAFWHVCCGQRVVLGGVRAFPNVTDVAGSSLGSAPHSRIYWMADALCTPPRELPHMPGVIDLDVY